MRTQGGVSVRVDSSLATGLCGQKGGLQFGRKRNYGCGVARVTETQVVDLETLNYSQARQDERFRIEFTSPFVLESEYSNTVDQDVP